MNKLYGPDPSEPKGSEITPERVWRQRRQLLAGLAGGLVGGLGLPAARAASGPGALAFTPNPALSTSQAPTPLSDVTSYNNFYEFGTSKSDPQRYSGSLRTRPWSVLVDGEVLKPRRFAIEDLLRLAPLEQRVYRHRCVEGWSMVIPWLGYSLSRLLAAVEPTGQARFVEMYTLLDPAEMPGQNSPILQWPYREGLRLDEAMHPLTLLCFGLYGEVLPHQNGAPLRLVVPWKYGFKGAKSIVHIRLVRQQPLTSWMQAAPDWYGFYSNVNPDVSPQNWSQATERPIGQGALGGLFAPRVRTQLFNGYAAQVASMYRGMDLKRYF